MRKVTSTCLAGVALCRGVLREVLERNERCGSNHTGRLRADCSRAASPPWDPLGTGPLQLGGGQRRCQAVRPAAEVVKRESGLRD